MTREAEERDEALPPELSSSLLVSEIFHSLQGEGRHAGAPSAFLRLARCNLSCSWCDTPYTWDYENYDFSEEVRRCTVFDIVTRLLDGDSAHLVVTGGEPLLQQRQLPALLVALDDACLRAGRAPMFVEVETNGTVPPLAALLARIDHWNVSPKLASAGDAEKLRLRWAVLEGFRDTGRADLKLVVREGDLEEADKLITKLRWSRERVVFMAQAADRAALAAHGPVISEAALLRNVRYSSRLHVELFGGRRGT